MPDLSASLALLTSPAILFFFIGAAAAFARSDLAIPEPVSRALSLYLMLAIGFKGGVEARAAGMNGDFLLAGSIGMALSALMPLLAFIILKRMARLDRPTLCALAATYGSVSVVTFAAGQQHLAAVGLTSGGYMAAVLALMETPAILTALLLLNGAGRGEPGHRRTILREVFVGAATVMLLGSFIVGLVSGQAGMARLEIFVGPLFQGALCFFLLDIGLITARRLMEGGRKLSAGVVAFALGFPVVSASIALALSRLANLEAGNAALLTILAGSASYIAVPAAMRLAAPKADAGVFVTASLAITFPFNLTPRTTPAGVRDYFVAFLKNRPAARIDTGTTEIDCRTASRVGIWTVTLTDPVTGAVRDVKARYSFLYRFENGAWRIDHLNSSTRGTPAWWAANRFRTHRGRVRRRQTASALRRRVPCRRKRRLRSRPLSGGRRCPPRIQAVLPDPASPRSRRLSR